MALQAFYLLLLSASTGHQASTLQVIVVPLHVPVWGPILKDKCAK